MKKLAFLVISLALGLTQLLAQAQVEFNNYKIGFGIDAPVYDTDGLTPLNSGYCGQLYVCLATDPLAKLAPVNLAVPFRNHPSTGLGTGYICEGSVGIPYPSGTKVQAQLRAWDSSGGTITTYEAALNAGKSLGQSEVILITLNHDLMPPSVLTGLKSFHLTGANRYSLSTAVNPVGTGSVDANPVSVDGKYDAGATVQLKANPAAGYMFSGWSGDLSGLASPASLIMNGNRSVIANFAPLPSRGLLDISVSPPNCGTIYVNPTRDPADGKYAPGTSVQLLAVANPGYAFSSWSGDGVSGSANPTYLTMNGDRSVTVNFVGTAIRRTLSLQASPAIAGGIAASPPPEADGKYASGTRITLTASANFGYVFSSWNGASGSNPITTVTIDGDKTVTANYTRDPGFSAGLQRQIYLNIAGFTLADLTRSAKFPNAPDLLNSVLTFESQYLANNAGENYGQRLTGYLVPPTTGSYLFYLASDDAGRVYLSTDENPANKRQIVEETGWNAARNWQGTASNPQRVSVSLSLTAGKFYYVEAWHKEGNNVDHFAVAWKLPNGSAPVNGSAPIGQPYLFYQPCGFILTPTALTVSATAGSASFTVQCIPGCAWVATPKCSWIHTTQTGTGNGTVTFTYDANSGGSDRLGIIQVGGKNFALTQRGQAPTIRTQPSSQVAALGATVTFPVQADGESLRYQWQFNGVNLASRTGVTGVNSSVLRLDNVTATQAGQYRVLVSNSYGTATSQPATLTLLQGPQITGQPISVTAPWNSLVQLTVAATGSAPLSYQWYFNSMAVSDATNPVLRFAQVQKAQEGDYYVEVGNAAGSVRSTVVKVTVTGAGPRNSFDLDADGKAELLVQHTDGTLGVWYLNGATFKKGAYINPPRISGGWALVAAGDFSADGQLDLLFESTSHDVGVWFLNGLTQSGSSYLTPAVLSVGWQLVGTGFFDADTNRDLVFQHNDGSLAVWLMQKTVMKNAQWINPTKVSDPGWRVQGAGDFNGDGRSDLLLQHQSTGLLSIWFMNGWTLTSGQYVSPANTGTPITKVVAVGDYDGDGGADIVLQRGGQLEIWFMNGAQRKSLGVINLDLNAAPGWKVVAPR
jgi:uncharacterized repeat protein (TIGR02543 family)